VDLRKTFQTTVEVLEFCRLHGVKRLVFASTSAVYGEHEDPLHEDMGKLLPISNYGAAKLAAESFISSYVSNYGLQAWIYRFPNVVGERSTHGAMFDFMNRLEQNPRELRILGDGEQSKPYLYVKDLIDGIWFAFQKAQEPLNIFNVAPEAGTSVRALAELCVARSPNPSAQILYTGGQRGWRGDVPCSRLDASALARLGYSLPRTSDEAVALGVQELAQEIFG
jgi:UDP-glucose 4-epimerase